jgi:hypothetical protein
MNNLREEIDFWWVTSSLEAKLQMAMTLLIGATFATLIVTSLLKALRPVRVTP